MVFNLKVNHIEKKDVNKSPLLSGHQPSCAVAYQGPRNPCVCIPLESSIFDLPFKDQWPMHQDHDKDLVAARTLAETNAMAKNWHVSAGFQVTYQDVCKTLACL